VENILPQTTGLVVKGDCANSLAATMQALISDDAKRQQMGQAARQYMESRSFEAAFDKTWDMFGSVNAIKQAVA
jgi:glycosyltransferase involved in cell wall biosynthesis